MKYRDFLTDSEIENIIEPIFKHNLGNEQLIKISKLSGSLGDYGIPADEILQIILDKYEKDGKLNLEHMR